MEAVSDRSSENVNYHRLYEHELTQDLWLEIFIRASVESLLRVKCVCTRWRSLVRNPSFTKKHLEIQKKTSKDKGCCLLQHYNHSTDVTNYFLFDVPSVTNVATSSFPRSDQPRFSFHNTCWGHQVYIEGPINGLYCVYGGTDRIVIWNPATKEVSFLPLAGECLPGKFVSYECRDDLNHYDRYISLGKLGFGTDPLNEQDYKVVMICEHDDESHAEELLSTLLYTTSTNTWRILKDDNFWIIDHPYKYFSNNTFLGGFYYWFYNHGDFVIAFDMGKEIFQKISVPNSYSRCQSYLVVNNDAINLLRVNNDLNEIVVWELSAEESIWIKKNSIVIEVREVYMSLVVFWNKDDMMLIVIHDSEIPMHAEGQTVLYNTTTRETTNVGLRGWATHLKAFVYYESLVSLSGNITKYRGSHASCLDAIWNFLCGDTTQDVIQELEEV